MGTHPIFESDFDCLTVMGSRSRSRSRSRSDSRSRSRSRSSRSRSRSRSRSYSRSRSRSRSVLGHDDGYDPAFKGYRVKVADLNTRITKYELEKEFDRYGRVLDLILIRRCPTGKRETHFTISSERPTIDFRSYNTKILDRYIIN